MTQSRSRFMRLTVIAATVALSAGALGGAAVVAQDESPAASDMALDGTGVDIEYIVKENINPFWVWQINAATAEADKLGANLRACWGVQDHSIPRARPRASRTPSLAAPTPSSSRRPTPVSRRPSTWHVKRAS